MLKNLVLYFSTRQSLKREEGVPVRVDLNAMRDNRIRDVINEWFRTSKGLLTKREAKNGSEGSGLREHIKEEIGLTRDELAQWIDRLLAEGTLAENKVDFDGPGRPRKILSLSSE